jgi:hypothetical protein
MSSVSDHIQLLKSQEKQHDSVFNTLMIPSPNKTKEHRLLKQPH